MSLSNYLSTRGKRGIWQLRVPVPRALQASYGRRERVRSLGTTDRALASRRALPILSAWQHEFSQHVPEQAVRTPRSERRVPSLHEMEEAAVASGYELEVEGADKARAIARGAS